ncbi:MAG: AMP-binding protein [Clostridia bacterium]|nr:AMP-binding protein [Clostridia bacterium]MBR4051257.1 AMP-binding protein [Clostridia bacterium]
MAEKTGVSLEEYLAYEKGMEDMPFSFVHKCAMAFGVELTDLLEGQSAKLTTYNVTRRGQGQVTANEEGILIQNLAPKFKNKLANPYWVKYEYSSELQTKPIEVTTHSGQEFDLVVKGSLKIRVGDHVEILHEGDSIFYNSSIPHGMIAVDGEDCLFLAMVMAEDEKLADNHMSTVNTGKSTAEEKLICDKFITTTVDENGVCNHIKFNNEDKFNFAFDVIDEIGRNYPEKVAMIHIAEDMTERKFTFKDIKEYSSQAANYFKSLGIKKGDRVLLVLKRNYQFWFAILGLHKLGAIAIPATNQLVVHDYEYRFNAAGVSAVVVTADGKATDYIDEAQKNCPTLKTKIVANGSKEGWHNFDEEFGLFSRRFVREADSACGDDPMIMLFTSGTTGYPKIAAHSHKYPLGHFITAKYWHCVQRDGVHFTISETGWGKALWGKLYGQWLCEGCVFVYDFERFDASKILPMFAKYNITTFCAPPTMYRMLIKQDISQYDLSSIKHATTAGEALNPEVFKQFEKATGLRIHEGFGQTETTLSIANLNGTKIKIGAMGKPTPLYDIDVVDPDGNSVADGETGEIVVRLGDKNPCGLFLGYYMGSYVDEEKTGEAMHDGLYHTGDTAWRDEDGYLWYVGRVDDVIKSSGYRIGPFEIENVIMELPYVLECGVSAAPDEVRGQVVKASIVLTKGTEPTEELKKEIQEYVKKNTAPYKYPRIVVFRDELPKTISGKIMRNKL